ncbi:MAG: winged helix-turn-helix domain-containing protein, partial [Sediminibacterium sp.]
MGQLFLSAAEEVLKNHQTPVSVDDIVQLAMDNQLLKSAGKTPINTMRARLSEHIRKHKSNSIFIRTRANKFGLRE